MPAGAQSAGTNVTESAELCFTSLMSLSKIPSEVLDPQYETRLISTGGRLRAWVMAGLAGFLGFDVKTASCTPPGNY